MALEPTVDQNADSALAELLQRASDAHAQFETVILKHPDPNWPRWLSDFLLDRDLNRLLPAPIGSDGLTALLRRFDSEYAINPGGEPRAAYFAHRLVDEVQSLQR